MFFSFVPSNIQATHPPLLGNKALAWKKIFDSICFQLYNRNIYSRRILPFHLLFYNSQKTFLVDAMRNMHGWGVKLEDFHCKFPRKANVYPWVFMLSKRYSHVAFKGVKYCKIPRRVIFAFIKSHSQEIFTFAEKF